MFFQEHINKSVRVNDHDLLTIFTDNTEEETVPTKLDIIYRTVKSHQPDVTCSRSGQKVCR